MKLLLRLLFRLLVLALSLPVILLIMLSLPQINTALIRTAADITEGLTIAGVEGTVVDRLSLKEIHYVSKTFDLYIARFDLDMKLLNLLQGDLYINSIYANQIIYRQLAEAEPEETDEEVFTLPLNIYLEHAVLDSIRYQDPEQSIEITKLVADLAIEEMLLTINQLSVDYQMLSAVISGRSELIAPFNLKLTTILQGHIPDVGELKSDWEILGNLKHLDVKQTLTTPFSLTINGFIEPENHLAMHLLGEWHGLKWPLENSPRFISDSGQFEVAGNLDDYGIDIKSDLSGVDLPASKLTVAAHANKEMIRFEQFRLNSNPGIAELVGELHWAGDLAWDVDFSLKDLPLDYWQNVIQGQVSCDAKIEGSYGQKTRVHVDLRSLQGRLDEYPLKGSGQFNYQNEKLKVDTFEVVAGSNKISIDGSIDAHSDLTVNLNAENLQEIDPALEGRVKASGRITGAIENPNAKLDMMVYGLKFEGYQLGQAKIGGYYIASPKHEWDFSADVSQIRIQEQKVDSVSFSTIGDFRDHAITLQLSSSMVDVDFKAAGKFSQQQLHWQGTLQNLQLRSDRFGAWLNEISSQMSLAFKHPGTGVDMTPLCLTQYLNQKSTEAQICASATAKTNEQVWRTTIQSINLSDFSHFLEDPIMLQGRLNAEFELEKNEQINGFINAHTQDAKISYASDLTGEQVVDFVVHVNGDLADDQLQADLDFASENKVKLASEVLVKNWQEQEQSNVDGQLQLAIPDLAVLNFIDLPISGFKGEVDAQLRVAGSLQAPYLASLSGVINKAGFRVDALGTQVSDFNFTARQLQQEIFQLSGQAEIANRTLNLNGKIKPGQTGEAELKLNIQGEHLKVAQLPEAEVWISPDLLIQMNQKGIDISGQLGVPEANLVFEQLPDNAVTVSQDEVLIPAETKDTKELKNVSVDVAILLGDDVNIQGFGLNTRMQGDLRAVYMNGRMQLFNELNLVDGVYQSYGQDLTIDKGQLLFSGVIDDPGINLLAYRKATQWDDNVIAYLRMTGTLKKPSTSIYTVPSLPQNEALSYLLTGGPLDGAGGSSAALLAKAAMYYGKDYIGGVADAVGIEEFDFKSTGVGEASLILGKQVLPGLYVRYIMDVITTQMVIAVEYQLTEQISIEARAGETHSSDIKYKFEFD